MEDSMISKVISNDLLDFRDLWSSWHERYFHYQNAQIDTDVLDAILTAKPEWLDETGSDYEITEWLSIGTYVKDVFLSDVTLLGMAIAYDDSSAQEIIRKHYHLLKKNENPVAKITGNNQLSVDIDAETLIKIKNVLDNNELADKAETLTSIFIELGAYVIKTTEQILAERHWFTPDVIAKMKEIWEKRWFLKETAYPKQIPRCHISHENGCMSLSCGINQFNMKADFYSAERIIIQQQDGQFDPWCGEPIDLTSIWPDRQFVIIVNSNDKRICGFAPIFAVYSKEKGFFTKDDDEFKIFVEEFHAFYDYMRENNNGKVPSEMTSFAQISLSLSFWLKDHCS